MLLSRKLVAGLWGSIQIDLYYASILACDNPFVILHRKKIKRYHVEDSSEPMNEPIFMEYKDISIYAIFSNFETPIEKESHKEESFEVWKMNFDGDHSKFSTSAYFVLIYPKSEVFNCVF